MSNFHACTHFCLLQCDCKQGVCAQKDALKKEELTPLEAAAKGYTTHEANFQSSYNGFIAGATYQKQQDEALRQSHKELVDFLLSFCCPPAMTWDELKSYNINLLKQAAALLSKAKQLNQ